VFHTRQRWLPNAFRTSLSKELISAAEIRVIVTIDFVTLSRDHILSVAFNNASDRSPMDWKRQSLLAAVAVCLGGWQNLAGQGAPGDKQPIAEDVFKNVQVLKGIPVSEFMATMGFFAASLGLNCVYCHVPESLQDWKKFADDVPRKRVARTMIQMVNAINKSNFGGRRAITCYSCHHGSQRPKDIPSLALQYGTPEEDPNEVEIPSPPVSGPSADEILGNFVKAVGGAERLAAVSILIGKGTYEGYDSYHEKVPFELYAKAPASIATVIHTQNGDSITVFNGSEGWIASVSNPVPLLPLVPGAELDGARLDAQLFFPAQIAQALSQWRSGFPVTSIGDSDVQVIEGMGTGRTRVKLFFDQKTGLLVRQLRYSRTAVGTNPIQIDYADYREVNGVKRPYRWTVTWTNGQSVYQVNELQSNVEIDKGRFEKPAPAVLLPAKAVVR
jgi:photosynthetic reaction center cytochrome c subunit